MWHRARGRFGMSRKSRVESRKDDGVRLGRKKCLWHFFNVTFIVLSSCLSTFDSRLTPYNPCLRILFYATLFVMIKHFEDIISWKKSRTLTVSVYKIFKNNKDYGFKDQIQRASVSIMNNIAEGFDRLSDKEFSRFLFISKASCSEVRSMLYLAKDLEYVTKEEFDSLFKQTVEISRLIAGLIKALK